MGGWRELEFRREKRLEGGESWRSAGRRYWRIERAGGQQGEEIGRVERAGG
jgi:hypothetical protein